ncbi:MAG: GTP cyclohydrolase I FolE [Paramuribaculum sp.]|nr:GTP cyclohydrolase I FolE [Paramuribaculum sp.]MDE5836778.1 GTP cyclohydrolase I FolE [Paramuribaculum sp.]
MDLEYPNDTIEAIAGHIEEILRLLGEDPQREGLLKTPVRAAKALYFATSGYKSNPEEVVGDALFTAPSDGQVIIKDIEFYSFCEHHILPFFGRVSVGYVPGSKILGLSKVARIVNLYARRLQTQERFTRQVCDAITESVGAKGVIVICNGQHMCMKMRGVEKQDSSTTTVATSGCYEESTQLRAEFISSLAYK